MCSKIEDFWHVKKIFDFKQEEKPSIREIAEVTKNLCVTKPQLATIRPSSSC